MYTNRCSVDCLPHFTLILPGARKTQRVQRLDTAVSTDVRHVPSTVIDEGRSLMLMNHLRGNGNHVFSV